MRVVAFHHPAFEQYTEWAATDKKVFERLHRLIVETSKTPFSGIGKPEPLKGTLKGYWSRRITLVPAHYRRASISLQGN